jgi:hypothetical protein
MSVYFFVEVCRLNTDLESLMYYTWGRGHSLRVCFFLYSVPYQYLCVWSPRCSPPPKKNVFVCFPFWV